MRVPSLIFLLITQSSLEHLRKEPAYLSEGLYQPMRKKQDILLSEHLLEAKGWVLAYIFSFKSPGDAMWVFNLSVSQCLPVCEG